MIEDELERLPPESPIPIPYPESPVGLPPEPPAGM